LGIAEDLLAQAVVFVPRLFGALLVLTIAWFVGRGAARLVTGLTDRLNVDKALLTTPIGDILGGTEKSVAGAFGTLAAWFVYAVGLLAAADVLAIETLSTWVATAVSYLPAFVAGLLVIVLGFIVADFVGDAIERTRAATRTVYTTMFATATRIFLYFVAVVIGLTTMGIDTTILNTVVQAFAWGLAAALAIGVGIALGWGGKDYVAGNIDRWMGRTTDIQSTLRPDDAGDASATPSDD
jgi:phage-related holin